MRGDGRIRGGLGGVDSGLRRNDGWGTGMTGGGRGRGCYRRLCKFYQGAAELGALLQL